MKNIYKVFIVSAVIMAAIAIILIGGGPGAEQGSEGAGPAAEGPEEALVTEPAVSGPDPDPFMKYARARVEEKPIVLEFYARN